MSPVFAQSLSDVTDEQIRLVIYALLAVAFLLGATTVWFFVHTNPKRRYEQALRSRPSGQRVRTHGDPAGSDVLDEVLADPLDPSAAPSRSTMAPSAGAHSQQAPAHHPAPATAADEDDEWLRLTSPQQRSQPPRRSHG